MKNNSYIIFYSVDITNSTPLKLMRKSETWQTSIARFHDYLSSELRRQKLKDITENNILKFWKFLGDEWIFTQEVHTISHLYIGIQTFQDIVLSYLSQEFSISSKIWSINTIDLYPIDTQLKITRDSTVEEKNALSDILIDVGAILLKSYINKNNVSDNTHRKMIPDANKDLEIIEKRDWISHFLDVGFRQGKDTPKYYLSISPFLAYLKYAITTLLVYCSSGVEQ